MRAIRAALVALAAINVVAIAVELATERHWNTPIQLVPWAVLVLLALAVVLAVPPPRPRLTAVVRALAVLALASALFGIYEHVLANYQAGALDQRFAGSWDGLSGWTRWWIAVTKTVGPAPPLAPGTLGQTALILLLATIGGRAPARAGSKSETLAPDSRLGGG